jgi:hypothetical protein
MQRVFNTAPYYDDFSRENKFYKILFRPGYAVQARELTQSQTIIGNQIEQFADHIFKFGAMVKPGEIAYDLDLSYVKIEPTLNGFPINLAEIDPEDESNAGSEVFIEGETSGVKAKVIKITQLEGSDPITIFVKYMDKGTEGTSSTFYPGDVNAVPDPIAAENIKKFGSANPIAKIMDSNFTPLGSASSVNIQEGVYYVNGVFADVSRQTLILDKYSNRPSYRVGLDIVERIITPSEDDSLNDNAQGSTNFAAPGAHRYSIDLVLIKKVISSAADDNRNFIELLRLNDGVREKQVTETEYSLIEDTLARRTYDESGDYYLRPFAIDVREHLKDETNRGIYPFASEDPNAKLGDETKLAVGLEPSKAYVKGYEINTIATTWVDVDKARDNAVFNNAAIRANLGNWVYVWNPYNFPSINTYQKVNLLAKAVTFGGTGQISNDSTLQDTNNIIGTARVRGFEFVSGTPGAPNSNPVALYKMFLFDIQMNTGYSFADAKTYYYVTDYGDDPVAGTLCQELYLVNPTNAPSVGDTVSSTDTLRQATVVSYSTSSGSLVVRPKIVSSYDYYPSLNINEFVTYGTATASIKDKITLHDTGSNALIFKLPKSAIKAVKGDNNQIDTTYTVKRVITTTVTNNSIIVNVSANETFDTYNSADYVLTVVENSSVYRGRIVDLTGTTVSISGTTLSISGLTTYNGLQVKLVAPVIKLVSYPNAKDLQTKTQVFATIAIDGSSNYLDEVDVSGIIQVKDSSNVDVTDRFTFDNGQRDTHYQRGAIIFKSGMTAPQNPVSVEYSFFRHGSGKDYFSVDSYNPVQVSYDQIPSYVSKDTGEIFLLSDCLDFRPRTNISSEGSMADYPNGQAEIIQPNVTVRADFQYYMGRIDKVYLDKKGLFRVLRGVSGDFPQPPEDPKDGMVLYVLSLPPYTYSTKDVSVKMIDNRRYTMRDIGKLEGRIQNLEYYTTLNMLEKATADMSIPDDSTGLDRFKNGFICDSFVGHGIGDVSNPDYTCSVDPEQGEMRPEFIQDIVGLQLQEVDPDNGSVAVSTDYAKTGDFITLPYTSTPLITQPYATKFVNVNPYNVFNWIGFLEINPQSDIWRDTTRKPDIIREDNGVFEAERARLTTNMGTVWNEWQTQWTGILASNSTTQRTREATPDRIIRGREVLPGIFDTQRQSGQTGQNTVTTTTTQQQGQVRTGVTSVVVPGRVMQSIDDRLLQTDLVPFMRSRDVYFTASRFKPTTRLFAFFDNEDVTKYCSGAGGSGFTTIPPNVVFAAPPSGTTATGRAIIHDGQIAFIEITNGGSGYTSAPTVTFTGVPNGATAPNSADIIVTVENGAVFSAGLKMLTDANGNLSGMFRIPNTDTLHFHTGLRVFRLCDDTFNRESFITTFGEARYQAQGLLETRQNTITSTREAEIVRSTISESRVMTSTVSTSQIITLDQPEPVTIIDPLAQTFLTTQNGGSFLTSIDVYFASKDSFIPVSLQIRNTVNGYPGQRVLPFGEVVINPDQVIVDPDGTRNLATRFTFRSPVFIQENIEYALVLLSNSDRYNVWVAKLGENQVGTTNPVSAQPYTGSLFKSQNASTWTAEQMEDLKFTVNSAVFNTAVTSNVIFVNEALTEDSLDSQCFWTVNGSKKVRVFHKNHGMPFAISPSSSKVYIDGVTGTINGIPAAEINGEHEIADVTLDSYTITVLTTVATATGFSGNSGITATKNLQMDVCHPVIQSLVLSGTSADFYVKSTTGKSVNGTQTPYQKETLWTSIVPNTNYTFAEPRLIASQLNETDLIQAGVGAYNNKSVAFRATMSSTRSNLSPVIDVQRIGLIVIGNRIADYTHATVNVNSPTDYDLRPATKTITISSGATISSVDNSITALTDVFVDNSIIGKYAKITATNNALNTYDTAVKIVDVVSKRKIIVDHTLSAASNVAVTIDVYDYFTGEEAPFDTSSPSKYITRPLQLNDPANSMKVYVTAMKYFDADFDVYYRVGRTSDTRLFTEVPYSLMSLDSVPQNNLGRFVEYSYSIDNVEPFTTVSFKIVPRSLNTAHVPILRDFRGIALST